MQPHSPWTMRLYLVCNLERPANPPDLFLGCTVQPYGTAVLYSRMVLEMRLAWWNGNADHPRLYPDSLTNAVIHAEESTNGASGLGGLAGDP